MHAFDDRQIYREVCWTHVCMRAGRDYLAFEPLQIMRTESIHQSHFIKFRKLKSNLYDLLLL